MFEVPISAHAFTPSNSLATITVGKSPWGVAYDSKSNLIYVTNNGGGISVINPSTNTVTSTIKTPSGLGEIVFDSANGLLYVANNGANIVYAIKGTSIVKSIKVAEGPMGFAVDTSNDQIFVSSQEKPAVSVINGKTNAVIHTITLASNSFPWDLAVDASSKTLYVADSELDQVVRINITTYAVVGTPITVGSDPWGVYYDPVNNDVYVTNFAGSSVSVISASTNKVVTTITVGTNPYGMAYYAASKQLYVTEAGNGAEANNVSQVSTITNKVAITIAGGDGPYGIAFDSKASALYIADHNDGPFLTTAKDQVVTVEAV